MYGGARVVVGFHHYGMITTRFALSLLAASRYEGAKLGALIERGGPYVDEARNQIAQEFLKLPFEYLLMIDADIEFPEDAITKTVFVADSMQADVVWGNYALGHFGNSIFVKDEGTRLLRPVGGLNPLQIYVDIDGGGTGWLLTRRRVLEKMVTAYPGPWHWFPREVTVDREGKPSILGEDLTFGMHARDLGFKQVGYTGLPLIHHKLKGIVPDFMKEFCTKLGFACVSDENPYAKDLVVKESKNELAAGDGGSPEGTGNPDGSEGRVEPPLLGEEHPAGREESGVVGSGEGQRDHLPEPGQPAQAGIEALAS